MSQDDDRPAVVGLSIAKSSTRWQNTEMQESAFIQQLETTLSQARIYIAQTRKALQEAHIDHRPAPPQPTTCCGSGCNGCVWEAWYAAVQYWQDQADQLIAHNTP